MSTSVALLKQAQQLVRDSCHVFRKHLQRTLQLHIGFNGFEHDGIQESFFQFEVGQEVGFRRLQFSLRLRLSNAEPLRGFQQVRNEQMLQFQCRS